MATLDVLDHEHVEWERVYRTAFLIHQHFRYEYPGPIEDLNHRLMIIPPDRHLDQRRVVYRVEVSSADAEVTTSHDSFGNVVLNLQAAHIEASISFEAWIVLERRRQWAPSGHFDSDYPPYIAVDDRPAVDHPPTVNHRPAVDHRLAGRRLLDPSSRTQPDEALRTAANTLTAEGHEGVELARRINTWVHQHMQYVHDVTAVRTTAAEALSLGHGVCQDYAHIMIALCRLCELPARYVSGHLLGDGGTHAWVEVLLPDGRPERVRVWPFDPTHNREPGLSYVTVAVGRDYADVAPTSGTYRASYAGRLSARQRVGLTAVDYGPA